mmetsp:Transcript_73444/g.147924  ORF Transcript_73444/g.147924 Transcript_73444/m.147924 type:complete len:228 (+) Transcript_73444:601-1284(+)
MAKPATCARTRSTARGPRAVICGYACRGHGASCPWSKWTCTNKSRATSPRPRLPPTRSGRWLVMPSKPSSPPPQAPRPSSKTSKFCRTKPPKTRKTQSSTRPASCTRRRERSSRYWPMVEHLRGVLLAPRSCGTLAATALTATRTSRTTLTRPRPPAKRRSGGLMTFARTATSGTASSSPNRASRAPLRPRQPQRTRQPQPLSHRRCLKKPTPRFQPRRSATLRCRG